MRRRTVLVVDDDRDIRENLARFLEGRRFGVLKAKDGSDAYAIAQETSPDIVVADADMPAMDGFQLCRLLRRSPRTARLPVILMSGAWTSDRDQVTGLDGGADDYIIKPFAPRVLLARIESRLLRAGAQAPHDVPELGSGGLRIDPEARRVFAEGKEARLTRKEFDLLALMLSRQGRVLSSVQLLEAVWGGGTAAGRRTLEVHLSSLRRKLGRRQGRRIVNLKGVGYRFSREEET